MCAVPKWSLGLDDKDEPSTDVTGPSLRAALTSSTRRSTTPCWRPGAKAGQDHDQGDTMTVTECAVARQDWGDVPCNRTSGRSPPKTCSHPPRVSMYSRIAVTRSSATS